MSEIMTLDEMESKFPDEWVLILDPESDPQLGLRRGRVACHSKSRDEVYEVAIAMHPNRFAVKFLGYGPENVALNL